MPWSKFSKVALGLGAAIAAVRSTMFTVDGGQRAVMFHRFEGILEEPVGEGTHRKIPWVQKPYIFDIRTKPYKINTDSGTKDLQMVNLTLRVMFRPDVSPTSDRDEVVKAVVAQFNADELLTERPQVSALIRETLIKRAKEFNIVLDDVSITGLSYGKEFSLAVERKQVAQQEAERSKFVVAKADQERRAAVIRAEGESEAARVISKATAEAGMGLIKLRRVEAAREVAITLSILPMSSICQVVGICCLQ
ncbi:Band 7 domain [Arabidopsis suecica]|uniref:Prohibitin n=1 Tax=Arabidopsis suecica TaxID=45249 RepID=A0A8T2D9V2_ARASU|nr:Band 7 domain [Arabidopsis suecica]